jgi:hypothetical protein
MKKQMASNWKRRIEGSRSSERATISSRTPKARRTLTAFGPVARESIRIDCARDQMEVSHTYANARADLPILSLRMGRK